jgi:hypothetical protein
MRNALNRGCIARQTGRVFFWLVAISLIAACATRSPAADTPPPPPPVTADGWLIFDDPAAPFTLRYPENVHLTHGQSKAGVYTARLQFRVPGVEGYQGMLVRVEPNPGGKGLEALLSDLYRRYDEGEPPAGLLAEAQQIVVSGQAGARVRAGGDGDFSIVLPVADQVYIIAPVHHMASVALDPAALELFHEVLATLEVRP